jgi:hypothetical protein
MMSTDGYRLEANDAPAIRRELAAPVTDGCPRPGGDPTTIPRCNPYLLFNIAQISEVNDLSGTVAITVN